MAINPLVIIERQLALLQAQSEKGTLTFEECQSLERLAKLQVLLKLKAVRSADDESCEEISSEDLKNLLPLLKTDET